MPTKYLAFFFDEDGGYLGEKEKINPDKVTFLHKDGAYNFDDSSCIMEYRRWKLVPFFYIREYHYYLNNPTPMKYGKMPQPVMDSRLYKLALEVDFVKQLQMLSKDSNVDWKKIFKWIAILGVAGLLIYFLFFNKGSAPTSAPTQLFATLLH